MIKNNYKIEIYNELINIKYYKEILEYNCKCISIKLDNIIIKVNGNNLMISKMDEYELNIVGKFNNIEFINE